MSSFKCMLAAAALCAAAGQANAATTVTNFDTGWYNDEGFHDSNNTNFITGLINVFGTNRLFNNFIAFDLASLAGQTIVSATLTIFGNNGAFVGTEPSETLGLFDYGGDIDQLLNGTGGVGAYDDLGGGSSYATTIVSGNRGEFMPEIVVSLSAAAIADINAALAGLDHRFAIGGTLLSVNVNAGTEDSLFSGSGAMFGGEATLTLETGSVSPVPLPAALPLFASGLAGMGLLSWRRRRASTL